MKQEWQIGVVALSALSLLAVAAPADAMWWGGLGSQASAQANAAAFNSGFGQSSAFAGANAFASTGMPQLQPPWWWHQPQPVHHVNKFIPKHHGHHFKNFHHRDCEFEFDDGEWEVECEDDD